MRMKSFKLVAITIFEECKYRKILHPGRYLLSSMDESWGDFFGMGVTVSAIVGKNGSGKSTLLEIAFRVINNFNAYTCSHLCNKNHPAVFYIEGLYAQIEYQIDQDNYSLICKGSMVELACNDSIIAKFDSEENLCFVPNLEGRVSILREFFYTAVVNYSPLAYNENEFNDDLISILDNNLNHLESNPGDNWLHNLFHKNDGYSVSINLNPFRTDGSINANTELTLTRNRIAAMLLLHPDKIIDGYELDMVEYWSDIEYLVKKLGLKGKGSNYVDLINSQTKRLIRNGSACKNLLEILLGEVPNPNNILRQACCIYICLKTLSIIEKYPLYESFKDLLKSDLLNRKGNPYDRERMIELAKILKWDKSHITLKIRQSIHLYKCIDNNTKLKLLVGLNNFEHYLQFNYHDYMKACGDKLISNNVTRQMEQMPPSFFSFRIKLRRKGIKEEKPIQISHLSTGERQFIYSTASIAYHLLNLKSVRAVKSRIHYRSMLVVLDEAELSYHPEYQRMFISRLIDLIGRLDPRHTMRVHFLLTTHSPFMLSDIPKCNVIYLKDGKIQEKNMKKSFCANICDILDQSFFLEETGMMGEFARQKVINAFQSLRPNASNADRAKYGNDALKHLIEAIGDEIISHTLKNAYDQSGRLSSDEINNRIEKYRTEIQKLEKLREDSI